MRITLFGATGLLGKALVREWIEDDVSPLGSQDADIRNAGSSEPNWSAKPALSGSSSPQPTPTWMVARLTPISHSP